jgi:hypothetical protein
MDFPSYLFSTINSYKANIYCELHPGPVGPPKIRAPPGVLMRHRRRRRRVGVGSTPQKLGNFYMVVIGQNPVGLVMISDD